MRTRLMVLASIVLLALPVVAQAGETWWEWLIRKLIESSGGWWGY